MATPNPAEPYRMLDCEELACGLPRTGAGRVPAGWIQIHYAAGRDTSLVEPDRWYCSAQCAARGLVKADTVASRSDAVDAALRAGDTGAARELAEAADAARTTRFSDLGVIGESPTEAAERAVTAF